MFRYSGREACATMLFLFACAFPTHAEVQFNRDIRPIMADTCFRCHGPDKSSRMAGMRLDIREEATKPLRDGKIPIVPGDPDKSEIIHRIFSPPARVMPPAYIHKELTEAQKNTIRQWVAEGAKYEGHWAYQTVHRPAVPAGAPNPVDAFILEHLAKVGLHAAPEADRRTLIRRVTLDLTGLPPTPEETEAFVKDTSPNAYEKVVDRLMASPRYAEQQTMHWLDFVRYADTCGFHGDNALPAWPYRDYVLNSYLHNKPFDQFTREQLAGDLLPNATVEQRVASAFNRLNRTSAEGGLQPKEYLAKYASDRVRTVATVWLGSTLGCADCHDHKFDPFTQRDFYSMQAFFADIQETGLVPDRGSKAWGTQLAIPSPEQKKQQEDLQKQIDEARLKLDAKMESLAPSRAVWEKRMLADYDAGRLAWHAQHPFSATSEHGAVLKIYNDEPVNLTHYDGSNVTAGREPGNGLIIASGPNPDNDTYTVKFKPGSGSWTQLSIELVQDESLPGIRVARGSDRVVITEVDAEVDGHPAAFSSGVSNLNNPTTEYPAEAAFDGNPKTGWAEATYNENPKTVLALRFSKPVHTEADTVMTVRLHHDSEYRRATTGRFRLALSSGQYAWPGADKGKEISDAMLKALREPDEKRTPQQRAAIDRLYQWASPEVQTDVLALDTLQLDAALLEQQIPHVVVAEAGIPRETRVLPRGNWMDESGAIVEPAIPAFLGKLDTGGKRATRLDLANWIVAPSNPLTARVYIGGQYVIESREHFEAANGAGSWGLTRFWTSNRDLLMNWLTENYFANGTYYLRVKSWDLAGSNLANPHILPLCDTGQDNGLVLAIDNRVVGAASGHPLGPAHPCGAGTVHLCTTEPDTDFLQVRINGAPAGACAVVEARDGGTLDIDFLAHDPDKHLAYYTLVATFGVNQVIDLLSLPGITLTSGSTAGGVPGAAQVGPDYGAALGQGAVAPGWAGGTVSLHIPDLRDAFPVSCCYQLELRAYKRTIYSCTDDVTSSADHSNLSEYSLTVIV